METGLKRKVTNSRSSFRSKQWSWKNTKKECLKLTLMFKLNTTKLWNRSKLCIETTVNWKMILIRLSVTSTLGKLSLKPLRELKIGKFKKWRIPLRLTKNMRLKWDKWKIDLIWKKVNLRWKLKNSRMQTSSKTEKLNSSD